MRNTVHERIQQELAKIPGPKKVLDVGCGIGTDSAWLVQQGATVWSLDASGAMASKTRHRVPEANVRQWDATQIAELAEEGPFDLILMNFGVINCMDETGIASTAAGLRRCIRPSGALILVSMPPIHPTWILSAMVKGDLRKARNRTRPVTQVDVEGTSVTTWYWSPKKLRHVLSPWFELQDQRALGVLLPPPGHSVHPTVLRVLEKMEPSIRTLPGARHMGDHVLLTFVRTEEERQTATTVRRWISTARNHVKASMGHVGPLHALVLHVTNGCQSECLGCEHRGPPDKQEISPARCQELVREAQALGCKEVILTGGEPLVRTDIEALLGHVSATGINVCLLTNGLALEKLAPIVARTCDRVIVSLDGHDDASYRQTRGVNGFSAVMRGVSSLRQCAETSHRSCGIFGRTTVHPTNIPHLASIANTAREHGFEGISFLAADRSHQQAFARNDKWQAANAPLTAQQRTALQSQLEELEKLRATGFVTDSKLALNRILDHYDGLYEAPRCNAPWRSVVVSADQTMQPCFFLPPYGTAKHGLKRGFKQAKPILKQLKIKHNPTCHQCVCWASLS